MTKPRDRRAAPSDRLVGGRYRLGPVIGRGGMATIHRAIDTRTDRAVAVKLLRPEVTRDADLAQRFRREALAATVLRHPNIVACLDTGTDDGQPYLVMDLIEGEDLAARLRRSGRLAPWQVARIGLDVARALGVAHLRGIVHRDIKPGNILLATDGRAMVTDFGIARLAADAEAALPGTTLGSVYYFSPEQARGATTTPASDVYGLGLVLYEALTGERAWTGETTDAIALARVGAPAPSPRSTRPEVPEALDAIVRRALAPDGADRYPSGNALAAALEPIVVAGDRATATSVVTVPSSASVAAAEQRPAPAAEKPASRRGNRPVQRVPPRARRSTPSTRSSRVPLATVLVILGLVGVGLLVAALPGRPSAAASLAVVTTPSPAPTDPPTPNPTPTPDPTPTSTPDPTPTAATADPTAVPPGDVADLCEIFFDIPCGLGPGRYAPSRFSPGFDIELGDGWSNAAHRADLVALTRAEGTFTFAGAIREAYPDGEAEEPRARAREIIEAFIATERVGSTKPASVRIDGRRDLSIDLSPTDSAPVTLFRTDGSTFQLEPDRTTRIVVMDVRGDTVLLAIEPRDGFDLRDILDSADAAAGTMRWR
ncbi:MAG: protein kinase domain-containing protein [Candidatus Limnocylindrales bacterium]